MITYFVRMIVKLRTLALENGSGCEEVIRKKATPQTICCTIYMVSVLGGFTNLSRLPMQYFKQCTMQEMYAHQTFNNVNMIGNTLPIPDL